MNMAIIQSRMGSSRLPGKVLKEIYDKTLLEHEINRIKYSTKIDKIIIATTTEAPDKNIEAFCHKKGILVYRGSEEDVLDRYYQTAKYFGAKNEDAIVRITGDCPLIDPYIIDQTIELFEKDEVDYASNVIPPTYPDGLDVEVFKFSVLERVWNEARLQSEREHVTQYIVKHPEIFRRVNLENEVDYSDLRWTVDEPEDFEVVKEIYERLYEEGKVFTMKDILFLLQEDPNIQKVNKGFARNEGLQKSIQNDRIIN